MCNRVLPLVFALAFTGIAAGQVPAPDFVVSASNLQLTSFDLTFQVQGPPGSPVYTFFTLDNPYLTPPNAITILPLLPMQVGPTGYGTLQLPPITWQGPLPDVWFAAVIFPPGAPPFVANVSHLSGAFAFFLAPDSANANTYNEATQDLAVRVKTDPGVTISVWEVPCNLLPPPPAIGLPFNTAPPSVHWLGGGVTDANGSFADNFTVPPGNCIVILADGIIVGVKREW